MRALSLVLCLELGLLVPSCDRGQGAADRETATPAVEAAAQKNASPGERADPSAEGGEPSAAESAEPVPSTDGESAVEIEDLPWDDPRAIALEVLGRCKGSDGARLKSVATAYNRRHDVVVKQGQTVCEAIFGRDSWRNRAVEAWDGEARSVRVRGNEARVMFHELRDNEVAVVSLAREADQWRFDDINSPDRGSYETWGEPVD